MSIPSRSPQQRVTSHPCVAPPRPTRRGFSLAEIVVVISIGALLAAIGLPMMRRWNETRRVQGAALQLQTFLANAQTNTNHGTVAILPLGASTFRQCNAIQVQVVGTQTFTATFTADGITFDGPGVSCLAITPGHGFDVTREGYLVVQGRTSDQIAYVTFNSAGKLGVISTPPASQVDSGSLGSTTADLISSGLVAVLPTADNGDGGRFTGGAPGPPRGP